MVKVFIIGVLLLAIEISAFRRTFNATDSPSTYALGSGRYKGGVIFRNAPTSKDEGFKTRSNPTVKLYRQRNTPDSSIMDQMKGKAIFYHRPDESHSPNRHSNFERKAGQSLRISEKTVNDTIREVEAIMRANPQIPRLSRQEMINIIENITNSNTFTLTESSTKNSLGQSREEYIRSLMLVMPFNTNNLSESMIQDLYTKPPITEIIDTVPTTTPTTNAWRIVVGEMSTESYDATKGSPATEKTTEYLRRTTAASISRPYSPTYPHTTNRIKYKNKHTTFGERPRLRINSTTTQNPTETTKEQDDAVSKISFTTEKPTTIYQYPESTIRRVRPKPTKAPFVVTATSVTPKPFKRIPAQVTIPSPLKKDGVLIRDDVKELLASIGLFPLDQPGNRNDSTTTTQHYTVTTTQAPFPMDVKQGVNTLTPEMQSLLKSFGLLDNEIPSAKVTVPKEITSSPIFNPPPPEPTVDIGSYVAFKPLPIQGSLSSTSSDKEKPKMGNEMKEFLASYGLLSEDDADSGKLSGSERTQKSRKTSFSLNERKFDKTEDDSLEEQNNEENGTKPASDLDLSIDTDMLPPDMKNVLQTLGLGSMLGIQNESNKNTSSDPVYTSTTSTETPEPTTTETTTASARTTKRIDSDISNDDVLIKSNDTVVTTTTTEKTTIEEENVTTEGHIFNPSEAVSIDENIENLSKLLKTVRLLANGTSQEDVESLLGDDGVELLQSDEGKHRKEKMTSLEEAENPPDPLSFEELVQIINSAKNEVKRQQPDNATSSNGTDSTEEGTPTIESSESSDRSPSIEDLAASFGGTNGEEEDSELPPPPSRPNGLYFLLDWNSFLEVGEDNSRVNLRFAPKVGDSRNFLPVTVP